MFLEKILEHKKKEVAERKALLPLPEIKRRVEEIPAPLDFEGAVRSRCGALIAEVKRSSPSRGRIREDFDPAAIARLYAENGAAAISVLTDQRFFEGRDSFLPQVRKSVPIPLLRKDFIIDPYQIYETRLLGGDAILLIARALGNAPLGEFIRLSLELGLSSLVEIHDEADLEKAVSAGGRTIGINNRDLSTFSTDLETSLRLAPLLPVGVTVVSESGIRSRRDVERLRAAGVHGFLVGEALMAAADIAGKTRELAGLGE
ncbi:MAG: indole-3-glycerol phosphate synthase TrpC [Syntrophaceae bacterium]|nr:indole-3-glycerol phosphate synthase TrpC [Syntrophaceae bacterium]